MIKSFGDDATVRRTMSKSLIITDGVHAMIKPVHPGEVLTEEFLTPMGLTSAQLAKGIKVSLSRVKEILLGRRGISVDTAIRLALFFGTTPELWQNLQSQYEMDIAKRDIWAKIKRSVVPYGKVAVL